MARSFHSTVNQSSVKPIQGATVGKRLVLKVAADVGVDVPIAREVDAVVNHGSTPERAYRGLLNEAPGHEVHGDSW